MAESYTIKDKIKIIIELIKNKTQGLGWYAASAKSFGKLFNWVESQLGEINKSQRNVLFLGLDAISYFKVGLNWAGALFESLWIIEQIKSKNDTVGNVVRVMRIGVNIISVAIDVSIMFLVSSLYQNPLILAISSVGLISKVIVYAKNIRSQVLDARLLKKLLGDKEKNAEQIKWLKFKILKRKWKFLSRAVKFLFSSLSLYLVVLSIVNSAPMIIGGLIIVGFASLITGKCLILLRDSFISGKRPVPRYSDMTLGELILELEKANAISKKIDDSFALDPCKTTDIKCAIADKQWYFRMLYVDIALAAVATSIFGAAVYLANPLLLVAVSAATVVALTAKVTMTVYKQIELESIKPIFTTPDPEELRELTSNDVNKEVKHCSDTNFMKLGRASKIGNVPDYAKYRLWGESGQKIVYDSSYDDHTKNLSGFKISQAGPTVGPNPHYL